jgi:hypothetical protein
VSGFFGKILSYLLPTLLDWAKEFFTSKIKKIKENKELKDKAKDRKAQAELVESLRQEILALVDAGQPVPKELRQRLENEARRLVRS